MSDLDPLDVLVTLFALFGCAGAVGLGIGVGQGFFRRWTAQRNLWDEAERLARFLYQDANPPGSTWSWEQLERTEREGHINRAHLYLSMAREP